jgi:glycerol-3-phosphate acyltransferase PlsY
MSGACAIAGHIWPVFLNFKGGKGVATTAGVLAGISPAVAGTGLLVWIAVFFIWKYVSLASISAAASLPLAGVIMGKDIALTGFLCVVAVMGVFSHRDNIRRLIKGTESRLR